MCVVNGKACNTTPSQAFVYHPYGMLDRDQRTTRTINSNINFSVQSLRGTKCNCCQCEKNPKNFSVKKNFKRQKDTFSTEEQCQISVFSSFRRSKNSFQNSSNGNQISQSTKTLYTNFKRTKFNSLLICICFWLLLLQKTRALPFKMTDDNLSCSDVRDAIEPILKQAQLSYDVNYAHVENFTQTAFNDNHQAHHNRWRTKHLPWLDPNGEPLQLDDYGKNLPEKAIQHLRLPGPPNREELTRELTNLYQRFEILARAFQVIKEHENETIAEYLKQQNEYVIRVLKETTDGMRKLRIKQPIVDVQIPEYKGVRELRDWIVTREHLKLLSYVQAYELLLQRCA